MRLARCVGGEDCAGQRIEKTDARLSPAHPITEETVYAEDQPGSTILGQYANRRSTDSAAPAGQMDSTEVIYLPTASGPMPVAAEINGRLYAIYSDQLNTPRRLTNQQGQVAWQWLLSGFGEVPPTTGANGYALNGIPGSRVYSEAVRFDLRYPGQVWDEETKLAYNLHRYYDAQLGRYVQSDPIGRDGGWNRYGYVGGNPVQFVDPRGLNKLDPFYGLSKAFWNWFHSVDGGKLINSLKDGKNVPEDVARDMHDEWVNAGKPNPRDSQKGSVDPNLLEGFLPWWLTPSPLGGPPCELPGGSSCKAPPPPKPCP